MNRERQTTPASRVYVVYAAFVFLKKRKKSTLQEPFILYKMLLSQRELVSQNMDSRSYYNWDLFGTMRAKKSDDETEEMEEKHRERLKYSDEKKVL